MNTKKAHIRATGQTQISIAMATELLAAVRKAAARDGRSVSNWIRNVIQKREIL